MCDWLGKAAGLLALLAATPAAAEALYLECAPSADTLALGRAARVMVDRDAAAIVWMERGETGVWRRDDYEILTTTPRELVAAARRDGDSLHLALDLDAGAWRLEKPLPRDRNADVWNAAEQRIGYPDSVQLYSRSTGVCRRVEGAG